MRNFVMADFEENVEEMVGMTSEAAGGDRVRRGRTGGPGDETGNKTAVTAGDERDRSDRWVMYTIDVRHVEEMVRTTREAADDDRVRRGRDGDETGGPGDEAGDKTAATAVDERDSGDR